MDPSIFLTILTSILIVAMVILGIAGAILPVLPGTWVVYGGMLLQHFLPDNGITYSTPILVAFGILTVAILIIDYLIPIWGSKKFGNASRTGQIGSMVGIIAGLFFMPIGIILGPFLGAVAGELIVGKTKTDALKSGVGAFLGFISGVALKVGLGAVMGIWMLVKWIQAF